MNIEQIYNVDSNGMMRLFGKNKDTNNFGFLAPTGFGITNYYTLNR